MSITLTWRPVIKALLMRAFPGVLIAAFVLLLPGLANSQVGLSPEDARPETEAQISLDQLFERLNGAKNESDAHAVAGQIWRRWLRSDDPDVAALMMRAQFARRAGLLAEAITLLDRVVAIAPEFAEGWNQRATVHYMMGNDALSVRDIERVLRLEPRHFGALSGLGLIHLRAGNWRAAIGAIERAGDIHPFLQEKQFIPELKKRLKGQPL